MKKNIKSIQEINKFAAGIAKKARPGQVLALVGDLGSGKTTFVKGFAKALGVKESIQSPTFILMRPYNYKKTKKQKNPEAAAAHRSRAGRKIFLHVDAYRVSSADELLDIGINEYLNSDAVVAIEWADKIKKILPPGRTVWIKFKLGDSPNERIVEVKD